MADLGKYRHAHCHAGAFLLRLAPVIHGWPRASVWFGSRRHGPDGWCWRGRGTASPTSFGFSRRLLALSAPFRAFAGWWRSHRTSLYAGFINACSHGADATGRPPGSRFGGDGGFGWRTRAVRAPDRCRRSAATRTYAGAIRCPNHRHCERSERRSLRHERSGIEPNPHRHRLLI